MLCDRPFFTFSLLVALGINGITQSAVAAQTIVPASDEIQTRIEQKNNIYTIEGGLRSGDNLFHSFEEFGLSTGEIANFLANPNIHNILTRIVGGNPSLIDGLIQTTGGNANLYLINPAGIVFGANASLNVSGDFFATTATGIGFSEDIFNVFGENNYANLIGTPLMFAFDLENPAPIINGGHLAVHPEQNLGLIGGSVMNTGTLTAKGGNILVTAVPGTNRVKLSRQDSLLSLEIELPLSEGGEILPITPLNLPELLVGAEQHNIATGLTTNLNGEIETAIGAMISQEMGTTWITGNIEVGNIAGEGGNIGIFGDRVILNHANIDASGQNGGGTILIGGDYQGQGNTPTATHTFIDKNTSIRADAIAQGNGGTIITWSDENTEIHGILSARGGTHSGDGGLIETSSKQTLQITSTPNASARFGTGGTWLIDPTDIRICNACTGSGGVGTSLIDVNNINAALNGGTGVTITTSIGGTDAGNIQQDADAFIQKTSGASTNLLFYAHNDIILQGGIESTSGQLYTGIFADGNDPVFASPSFISSDNFGRVVIDKPIVSNGGNIRLYGRNIQANLTAVEVNADLNSGGGLIEINGANFSSASGDNSQGVAIEGNINSGHGIIDIQGTSINGQGVDLNGAIIANGSKIEIRGTSTNQEAVHSNGFSNINTNGGILQIVGNSTNNDGIDLNGTIQSSGGDVFLSGINQNTSLADTQGVEIAGSLVSGGGEIVISGTGDLIGIEINKIVDSGGGTIGLYGTSAKGIGVIVRDTLNSGTGTIGITADTLDLSDINASLTGNGALIFRPENSNQILTLGGTGVAGTTFLNATEISRIQAGFSDIRIEDGSTNTAIVKLENSAMFLDPLIIQNVAALKGPDSNRTWTLTGNRQGTIGGYSHSVSFNNVATIRGGSRDDIFAFNAGVNFNGIVDGGAGIDTLDYSNYGSSATINLLNNTATGTLGILNIEGAIATQPITPPTLPLSPKPPALPTLPIIAETAYLPGLTTSQTNLDTLSSFGEDDRQEINGIDRQKIADFLDIGDLENAIAALDRYYSKNFLRYLGQEDDATKTSLAEIQQTLQQMEGETGTTAATIYIFSRPEQLDLILVPPRGEPLRYALPEVSRATLLSEIYSFQEAIAHPIHRRNTRYLPPAQQLHQWLIAPTERDLHRFNVDTLMFVLDDGLRTLPIAALHDGKQFAIENYAISLIPSLHLVPARYTDMRNSSMVAMGMSEFTNQEALPAVPVEVATIAEEFNTPDIFLNETFTFKNLQRESSQKGAQILHLATHGQFQPGTPAESYIQLWDRPLTLTEMAALKWGENAIELLVLSACRTALGDESAEYGFAGLTVQSGVSSAVASLWYANDAGTLALMTEFYRQLRESPTKAQALQQAQIALIREEVRLEKEESWADRKEIGELVSPFGRVTLPPELANLSDRVFQHPYYWSGFTLIGSPW
jgi:filamentous hemagglutinin family protein